MAAAISTRCMTWPPSNLPRGFVMAGRTTSAISERDALIGLAFNARSLVGESFLRFGILSSAECDFGVLCPAAILPAHDGRPNENAARVAGNVRGTKTRRRLFSLRLGYGMPERRRHQRGRK